MTYTADGIRFVAFHLNDIVNARPQGDPDNQLAHTFRRRQVQQPARERFEPLASGFEVAILEALFSPSCVSSAPRGPPSGKSAP